MSSTHVALMTNIPGGLEQLQPHEASLPVVQLEIGMRGASNPFRLHSCTPANLILPELHSLHQIWDIVHQSREAVQDGKPSHIANPAGWQMFLCASGPRRCHCSNRDQRWAERSWGPPHFGGLHAGFLRTKINKSQRDIPHCHTRTHYTTAVSRRKKQTVRSLCIVSLSSRPRLI